MLGILVLDVLIALIALILFVVVLDHREREPIRYLVWAFGAGILGALLELLLFRVAIVKFFFSDNPLEFALLINDELDGLRISKFTLAASIMGGLLKEGTKTILFYWIMNRIHRHSLRLQRETEVNQFDGIVYACTLTIGYLLVENGLFLDSSRPFWEWNTFNGIANTIKHLICAISLGYIFEWQFFRYGSCQNRAVLASSPLARIGLIILSALVPIVLHVLFRIVFFEKYLYAYALLSVISLALSIFLIRKGLQTYSFDS